ncbi:hypothetical protein ACIBPB_19910 [Micromonospora sp. NPDC049836]|uniref:hypothetical protein n=1 Tax=Micromonospora sp. NPDC049836 TaxID=3364274 RepID=UPI00379331D9
MILASLTYTDSDHIDALTLAEQVVALCFDRRSDAEARLVRAHASGDSQEIADAADAVVIARRMLTNAHAALRHIRGDQ